MSDVEDPWMALPFFVCFLILAVVSWIGGSLDVTSQTSTVTVVAFLWVIVCMSLFVLVVFHYCPFKRMHARSDAVHEPEATPVRCVADFRVVARPLMRPLYHGKTAHPLAAPVPGMIPVRMRTSTPMPLQQPTYGRPPGANVQPPIILPPIRAPARLSGPGLVQQSRAQ
uniref:Uncharacterized protein n=1 Tax=Noctiluca scintillans TaxID=2966 RepID=A0A7S1FHA7_NOCSC|mmetsp:Transcript_6118/g.17121  ORF Transcript_6118/g.17121 Transcript_6118/m.17121 type:complete len:169 (+) Transcript_6118:46-552(+)